MGASAAARRHRRVLVALIATAIVALAASGALASGAAHGASMSNGVASKSPTAIVAAARAAIDGVSTVHVAGAGTENGTTITLDLHLVAGRGGRGSVSQGGVGFQLVVIGPTLYFNGSLAFWRKSGESAAGALLAGRWLKAPATGQFASVATFTNIGSLFAELLSPKGTLARGALTTVLGEPVVAVTDTANGGTLYVATTGKPYPVELVNTTDKKPESVVVNDIDAPVSLVAPPNSIDISKLSGT